MPRKKKGFGLFGRRVSLALSLGKKKSGKDLQDIQVRMLSGAIVNVNVKPTTSAGAVCVALRGSIGLDNDCDYGLFLATGDGSFSALEHDMKLSDVINKLPAVLRGAAKFYYKRRSYFPGGQTELAEGRCSNPKQAEHKLAYTEAVYHYLHGHLRFPPTETARLSALLLQGHLGDQVEAEHSPKELLKSFPVVVPTAAVAEEGSPAIDGVTDHAAPLATAVVAQHKELRGLTKMEAQVTFLNKVKANSGYGSDFFPSKRTWKSRAESGSEDKVKSRTEDIMVAIGRDGIQLWTDLDPFNVSKYDYEVITKWTVSRDGKIFAFCVEDDLVVYLVTTQASTIEAVIERYVADLVANRSGSSKAPISAPDAATASVADLVPEPKYLDHLSYNVNLMGHAPDAAVLAALAFATAGKNKFKLQNAAAAIKAKASSVTSGDTDEAKAPPPPDDADLVPPPPDDGAMDDIIAPPPVPEGEGVPGPPPEDEAEAEAEAGGGEAEAAAGGEAEAEAAATEGDDADSLASGFEELMSEDGFPYYFNEATGESLWDKPRKAKAGAGGAGAGEEGEAAAAPAEGEAEAAAEGAAEASDELPPGWTAEQDDDGYTYYVNELTDATQWEKPTEPAVGEDGTVATAETATAAAAAAPVEVALPWEACVDDNGDTYYWNQETGETSWEPPVA